MSENRQRTDSPSRKAPKTAFQKGRSGNPGGRPKKTQEELDLISACKAKTPAALAVIETIMLEGENERNKLSAAMAIIERAYGKPLQQVEQTIDAVVRSPKEMTDEELAAIAAGSGA